MRCPDLEPEVFDFESETVLRKLHWAVYRNFGNTTLDVREMGVAWMYQAVCERGDFCFYQDLSRFSPNHASDWEEQLKGQFGVKNIAYTSQVTPAFFNLFNQSFRLAAQFKLPAPTSGEIVDLFHGLMTSLEEYGGETVDKFQDMSGESRFGAYREKAYELRGLTYNRKYT